MKHKHKVWHFLGLFTSMVNILMADYNTHDYHLPPIVIQLWSFKHNIKFQLCTPGTVMLLKHGGEEYDDHPKCLEGEPLQWWEEAKRSKA